MLWFAALQGSFVQISCFAFRLAIITQNRAFCKPYDKTDALVTKIDGAGGSFCACCPALAGPSSARDDHGRALRAELFRRYFPGKKKKPHKIQRMNVEFCRAFGWAGRIWRAAP